MSQRWIKMVRLFFVRCSTLVQRITHLEPSEMNTRVKLWTFLKNLLHTLIITNIKLIKLQTFTSFLFGQITNSNDTI